eukprot:COSAG06_NODE_9139_length_1975_cov_187.329782_2_plen_285_part_00
MEREGRALCLSLSLLTSRKHSRPTEAHHQHNRRHPRTQRTPYHTKRASKPARVSHRSTARHTVHVHADPNTHTQTHTERGTIEQRQRDTLFSLSLLTGRKHSPCPEAHHQHNRRNNPRTQHTPYHTKRASRPARVSHRSTAKHIVHIHADLHTHADTEIERTETEAETFFSLSLLTGRKHSPAPEAHHQHNHRHTHAHSTHHITPSAQASQQGSAIAPLPSTPYASTQIQTHTRRRIATGRKKNREIDKLSLAQRHRERETDARADKTAVTVHVQYICTSLSST